MVIFFEDSVKQGIPVNEYYLPNQSTYKGVFFVVHGFESSKDFGVGLLPKQIAELGYFVVSVDAYKHGLRIQEPFLSGDDWTKTKSIFEIIEQTTNDIAMLYQTEYSSISNVVGISGFSMGAMISYQLPRILPEVQIIVPFIGTPRLTTLLNIPKYINLVNSMSKKESDDIQHICHKLDLSFHLQRYTSLSILALVGQKDGMVSMEDNVQFIQHIQHLGNHFASIKSYPVGHQLSDDMINDALNFIRKFGESNND